MALQIGDDLMLRVFNLYNDGNHSHSLMALIWETGSQTAVVQGKKATYAVWMGELNHHHLMWDEEHNHHLFTAPNLNAVQKLLDILVERNMGMVLPAGTPTLVAANSKIQTRPDNVFCGHDFKDNFLVCKTDPAKRPPSINHIPIISAIKLIMAQRANTIRLNFRATDLPMFHKALKLTLLELPIRKELVMARDFNLTFDRLTSTIDRIIEAHVPATKTSPHSKRWWSKVLAATRATTHKVGNRVHTRRNYIHYLVHKLFKIALNNYAEQHTHSFLGLIISQELRFKEHAARASKGNSLGVIIQETFKAVSGCANQICEVILFKCGRTLHAICY